MNWPRASLLRRLTLAFVAGHVLGLLVLFVGLLPFARDDAFDQVGPGAAILMLSEDLVDRSGTLALVPGARFEALAKASPNAWFIAEKNGRVTTWGRVPQEATALFETASASVKEAEFGGVGHQGRVGDATLVRTETAAGEIVIAVGGISPAAVTFPVWLSYLLDMEYPFFVIGSALLSIVGALIAIPLLLLSIRPTARAAAALDPSDFTKRLPDERVVKELLPLVRAFNAALARLEEAFERRRRFIADMAHELRTPVAVLNMHVEAMPDGGNKKDLQRSVFRLGQMIGQMLDAQRLTMAARDRERVDLVEVSRSTVADIAPLAVANGYEIEVHVAADAVPIEGDRYAVGRALSNLLGNAIAHGGGTGTIEVRVASDGRVDVTDQGPGVPEEARARIFEPFRRERWDRDGCGLGLHLVREIMHVHGGTAQLVSSGPGAMFRLQFPVVRAS